MSALFWSLVRVMSVRDADTLVLETGKVPVLVRSGHAEPLTTAVLGRDLLGDLEATLAGNVAVYLRDPRGRVFEAAMQPAGDQVRVIVRSTAGVAAGVWIEPPLPSPSTINELVTSTMIGATRLELVAGDIAEQDTDAVVTAAQQNLSGGQGTDGVIHFLAGPRLLDECRTIGWCPVGSAVITRGYQLKARHVIHAVGPVWDRGLANEAEALVAAYQSSLRLAASHHLHSISFPSISTGAFCYPMRLAAPIAMNAIIEFLDHARHELELVRMVVYGRGPREAREIYLEALRRTGRLAPVIDA